MFTGLVKDVGRIAAIERRGDGSHRLTIETDLGTDDFEVGESIAIDGACLTVVSVKNGQFAVETSPETREVTTLGALKVGDGLHLERALRVGDRLGGHFVTGHIDGVGELVSREEKSDCWELTFAAPASVSKYLIPKGSIAVDGVSLTVNAVEGPEFQVTIIPHTGAETKLADYEVGVAVNLEADLLGKYVERLHGEDALAGDSAANIAESIGSDHGEQ